jgi:hypothetical protein
MTAFLDAHRVQDSKGRSGLLPCDDGRRGRRLLQNDATPAVPTTVATTTYPKLIAVTEAVDAKADAIPVAAADRSAADAFEAYRRESDAAYAQMAAAAATGSRTGSTPPGTRSIACSTTVRR